MMLSTATATMLDLLTALGHGYCLVDSAGRASAPSTLLASWGIGEGAPLPDILLGAAQRARATGAPAAAANFALGPRQFEVHATPAEGDAVLLVFKDCSGTRRLREQFERVLDSTPDGIFVIDRDRQVLLCNRAFAELTGRKPMEILHSGCSCSDVVNCHNENGVSYAAGLCPAKSVFIGQEAHSREEMLLTNASGEERWIETTYSSICDEQGGVECVVAILRDVHERKLLEDRLHQNEKLASLGQLVAGIAHEIKNPLAIILSSLDVIQNAQRPEVEKEEAASFIRQEIRRLDERLRAFLAFSRPRPPQLEAFGLGSLAGQRVERMRLLFPGVEFTFEADAAVGPVRADREQVDQVLTNLILNAGEAMGGSGRISVRVRRGRAGGAALEVEDTGGGVPEEFRARIFDPFFTTKADGTGLGLSVCYQIVLAHKGTISIGGSSDGTGACFTVRLPGA